MFIRLTTPLDVLPGAILSRAVVDPNDPMHELAPSPEIPINATVLAVRDDDGRTTYQHEDPWALWDMLLLHPDAGPAIYGRLSLYGRLYFVVGARIERTPPAAEVLDQDDGDAESFKLLGPVHPEGKIVELEYVQVTKLKDGSLDYLEYGTELDVQLSRARKWTHDHPIATRVLKGAGIGVGVAAATPLVVGGILGAVGFTAGGVAAGSIAAGIQAGIGNVAAGSLFAIFQSVGAAGLAAGTVVGVGGAAAGAAIAVDTVHEVRNRRDARAEDVSEPPSEPEETGPQNNIMVERGPVVSEEHDDGRNM